MVVRSDRTISVCEGGRALSPRPSQPSMGLQVARNTSVLR
jgi:hypothetical protein